MASGLHHAGIPPNQPAPWSATALAAGLALAAAAPDWVKQRVLTRILNCVFREALASGDLDFLAGRRLGIRIEDAGILWGFTHTARKLVVLGRQAALEVTIRGTAADFLLMASRRADPDALFFQRRIVIEGDVELGIAAKNFMDTLELDELPLVLRTPLLVLSRILAAGESPARAD